MAKQTAKNTANDLNNLFDPQGYQDAFKTVASMNERLAEITAEAGTRATDVASETAKEAFSNVRELTQVREEPAEYGKAYTDFLQKQTALFMRTAEAFGNVTQKAGNATTDLASKAGEDLTSKVAANTEGAAQKARSAANKAA